MTRGEGTTHKLHLQGTHEDFIVYIDSPADLEKFRADPGATALSSVASNFKIYVTHKHGNQGPFDEASNEVLFDQFNTEDRDAVLRSILLDEKAEVINAQTSGRQGHTNLSNEGGR